jgi:hypothetical protein
MPRLQIIGAAQALHFSLTKAQGKKIYAVKIQRHQKTTITRSRVTELRPSNIILLPPAIRLKKSSSV